MHRQLSAIVVTTDVGHYVDITIEGAITQHQLGSIVACEGYKRRLLCLAAQLA